MTKKCVVLQKTVRLGPRDGVREVFDVQVFHLHDLNKLELTSIRCRYRHCGKSRLGDLFINWAQIWMHARCLFGRKYRGVPFEDLQMDEMRLALLKLAETDSELKQAFVLELAQGG
jgi:hypothetical protein